MFDCSREGIKICLNSMTTGQPHKKCLISKSYFIWLS